MIAIGIGCRQACPAQDILDAVAQAMARMPDGMAASGLFTIVEKRGELGLSHAATVLGLPLVYLDRSILRLVAGKAQSCSSRVEDLYGVPSVAETAALAGAGQGAVLLVPRCSGPRATCAIAGTS